MHLGSGRVSTDDQHSDLQLAAWKRAGCRMICLGMVCCSPWVTLAR